LTSDAFRISSVCTSPALLTRCIGTKDTSISSGIYLVFELIVQNSSNTLKSFLQDYAVLPLPFQVLAM
jgi:hypothetical protein